MAPLPLAAILVLAWCLYTVASLFVALRLWVRIKRNNQRLNISDGFMSLCWFANAVACVAITYWALVHLKYGRHELVGREFVRRAVRADQEGALKACVVAAFAYYFCLWSLKLSMLCQYFSLYEHLKKSLRWVLAAATALTAMLFVAVVVLNLTRCLPMKRNWTILPVEEFCVSFMKKDVFLFSTVANVVTDLIVMILPFFVLHALPRPIKARSERVAIVVIFLLGLLSITFTLVRYIRVSTTTHFQPERFSMAQVALWTIFELQIAMVAGCLPSLRVLLSDKRHSRATSTGSGKAAGTSSSSSYRGHRKLDSTSSTSSFGTVKSNFTYLPSMEKERFGTWSLPRTEYRFHGGNGQTSIPTVPAVPVPAITIRSPPPTTDHRASSQYSTTSSSWDDAHSDAGSNLSSSSSGGSSFLEQTAVAVQLPSSTYAGAPRRSEYHTSYPGGRQHHSRNFSTDSAVSVGTTSEEVFITMELSPRPRSGVRREGSRLGGGNGRRYY